MATTGVSAIGIALAALARTRVATTGLMNVAVNTSASVMGAAHTGGSLAIGIALSGAPMTVLTATGASTVDITLTGIGRMPTPNAGLSGWYSDGTLTRPGTLVYWTGTNSVPISSVIAIGGASA